MRSLLDPKIDRWRDRSRDVIARYGSVGDATCGRFHVPSPIDRVPLRIIASQGGGWDHISVSRHNRCPNWTEMEHIKRMFFQPEEVCMQLHVAESEHISVAHNCLHIWRPNDGAAIPLPPGIMV